MAIVLGDNRYGKAETRVVRVTRKRVGGKGVLRHDAYRTRLLSAMWPEHVIWPIRGPPGWSRHRARAVRAPRQIGLRRPVDQLSCCVGRRPAARSVPIIGR